MLKALENNIQKAEQKVRALLLPFPVQGKGMGDGSRFADTKLYGYRRNLYPKTKFEQKRGIPLPVYGAGAGVGSLLKARVFRFLMVKEQKSTSRGDRAQYFPTFGKY